MCSSAAKHTHRVAAALSCLCSTAPCTLSDGTASTATHAGQRQARCVALQARSQSTALLRPCFLYTNISVYSIHLLLLVLCGFQATFRVANVRYPSAARRDASLCCSAERVV